VKSADTRPPSRLPAGQTIRGKQRCRASSTDSFGHDEKSKVKSMIRIIIKTERRVVPGAPITTSHEVLEVDAPAVSQRVLAGGYNEDGTFEISQVIGVEVPRG
jgi:hypothetical protein